MRCEHVVALAHLLFERRELRLHSLYGLAVGSQNPLAHLCLMVEGSELLPKARSHPSVHSIIGDLMGQNRGEQLPQDLFHKNDERSYKPAMGGKLEVIDIIAAMKGGKVCCQLVIRKMAGLVFRRMRLPA